MNICRHQSHQMVYIPKGEHDNPHELPQHQELEGSTEIEQTLYSHPDTISSETNPFQKLSYIYKHFQDNEKIHESDPNLARYENDNAIRPHINNNIEYGLFEDVISSYYLDSPIRDDFKCDQNCYINTQQKQQDQPLTLHDPGSRNCAIFVLYTVSIVLSFTSRV